MVERSRLTGTIPTNPELVTPISPEYTASLERQLREFLDLEIQICPSFVSALPESGDYNFTELRLLPSERINSQDWRRLRESIPAEVEFLREIGTEEDSEDQLLPTLTLGQTERAAGGGITAEQDELTLTAEGWSFSFVFIPGKEPVVRSKQIADFYPGVDMTKPYPSIMEDNTEGPRRVPKWERPVSVEDKDEIEAIIDVLTRKSNAERIQLKQGFNKIQKSFI